MVAPLNWGLGHATRCIPIIQNLELQGYIPILASDGMALELLKKEFPHLVTLELPSYRIKYPKNGSYFQLKMLQNLPNIFSAINSERKLVADWNNEYRFAGIISDNRAGVHLKNVPSVYITHQIKVLSGFTTTISSFLHRKTISKFDECWIPDFKDSPNLSFELGHSSVNNIRQKFIGTISRLKKSTLPQVWDLMIILSGPEPQRGILEDILRKEIQRYNGKVLFVQGNISATQEMVVTDNVTFYNFMTTNQLEKSINQSGLILCRSGYTSVMDLVEVGKMCFFIPTPGQYEQEYLAHQYDKNKYAPFSKQADFKIEDLKQVENYKGFPQTENLPNWKELFRLFDSE